MVNFRFLGLICICIFCAVSSNAQVDEYDGPFKSWANVKSRFGAKGDGKNDDTKAIQKAIDQLANFEMGVNIENQPFTVLYFPAGTYLLSETILVEGKIGVTLIGEDPGNTIFKWIGKDKDTMVLFNGSAYFRVSRFGWNANGRKELEGLGVHWMNRWNTPKSRSYASLNIELSDMFFSGFAAGIGGGTLYETGATGSNDSEVTIKRCSFEKCDAGIRIVGFNALDYWIWYCKFVDCKIGVRNAHGNFHIYKSVFKRSSETDTYTKGGYYTSVRECYSIDSKQFSVDEGVSCNPFKRIYQSNVVLNNKVRSIEYYHLGNLSVFDNIFSTTPKVGIPQINLGSWCPGFYSFLSINNRYSKDSAVLFDMVRRNDMRYFDKVLTAKQRQSAIAEPVLPSWPVKANRLVIEVPLNSTTAEIQQLINKSAKNGGKSVVLHFPPGKFMLTETLLIPAGANLSIVGDGIVHSSRLLAANPAKMANQPLILIDGPTNVNFSEIQIGEHTTSTKFGSAIQCRNIDNAGSKLILDQVYSSTDTSLVLKNLNYLYVEKRNSFFNDGNIIEGGKIQRAGNGTFRVMFNGGQFARLNLKGNVSLLARDCWWEGGSTRIPLHVRGDGNLAIDGAMISPYLADSTASIFIDKFSGKVSLTNIYMYGGLKVEPNNSKLELLCWNMHFYHSMHPNLAINSKGTYKALLSGFSCQCFETERKECGQMVTFEPVKRNVSNEGDFFNRMTQLSRTRLIPIAVPSKTSKTTLVYLSRVSMGTALNGVKVINEN